MPSMLLFYSIMDPSMSTLLDPETCVIDAPNLNQAYEHTITIGLQDWVKDLGFMPSLCIHASYETFRPLFATLCDVGYECNAYDWS